MRTYIAGGDTLIGRALIRCFQRNGFANLVGLPPREPDLTQSVQVENFFAHAKPQAVVVAAGLSGGIEANQSFPADLMMNNQLVGTNVIVAAFRQRVGKLLYVGSSCMYPKNAAQPYRPETLFSGPMERSSEAYATAKLACVKLCQALHQQYRAPFITGIPANVFGPGDDFRPHSGHVIPGLMRRLHQAKWSGTPFVEIWGSGRPRRDFLYADDLADACLFLLRNYDSETPINITSGVEHTIGDVARQVAKVVGYDGELRFDPSKPDGAPRKCLDGSKLFDLGWRPATSFEEALRQTYDWLLKNHEDFESNQGQGAPRDSVYVSRSPDPVTDSTHRARKVSEAVFGHG